jgi:uncharacterized membrane protein YgcG
VGVAYVVTTKPAPLYFALAPLISGAVPTLARVLKVAGPRPKSVGLRLDHIGGLPLFAGGTILLKLNPMSVGLLALVAGPFACNVHDNTINATATIPNATLNVSADTDVNTIMPSQSVPMTVTVTNVTLVEPTATPLAGHEMDAGYFEFHVDDETMPAVLVTAQTQVQVPIPADTKEGPHKIICRLHKHDGTPTVTKFEVNITVKVSVTVGGVGGMSGGTGGTGAGGAAGSSGAGGAVGGGTDASATD